MPFLQLFEEEESVRVKREQGMQVAIEKAKEELGELYELTEIGEAATFDGLTKELEIQERLDAAINRCLKQLLMVRGVKSHDGRTVVDLPETPYWALKSRVTKIPRKREELQRQLHFTANYNL